MPRPTGDAAAPGEPGLGELLTRSDERARSSVSDPFYGPRHEHVIAVHHRLHDLSGPRYRVPRLCGHRRAGADRVGPDADSAAALVVLAERGLVAPLRDPRERRTAGDGYGGRVAPPTHPRLRTPSARADGPGWVAAIGCWAAALAFFWWQSGIWASASLDVGIYREAAADLLAGGDVYDGSYGATGLPFTYPPFGLLLVPLAVIPQAAAGAVMFAGSAAALVGRLRLAGQYAARAVPAGWAATVAAAFVAVVVEPVRVTLGLGQINLLILVVILALDAGARQRVRGSGPVSARRSRSPPRPAGGRSTRARGPARFLRGVAAFAACTLVAALVLPPPPVAISPDCCGSPTARERSPMRGEPVPCGGMVERIVPGLTAAWLITVVAVLALAAVGVHRHRSDPWLALTVAAVAGLLISPVSWSHHWVWVLPVAAVSARYWRRRPWWPGPAWCWSRPPAC